jgi:hypothetical protein
MSLLGGADSDRYRSYGRRGHAPARAVPDVAGVPT